MNLNLVLVRTEFSGNIGSAARALANMGGQRLILINPHCEVDGEARQMAAGARLWLDSAVIYKSWDHFYASEGDGLRIALSRRGGRKRKVLPLAESLTELSQPQNLYLILGPEADGLDAADLAYANFVCHLPVQSDFGSLNLAQAALLALFLVRQRFPNAPVVQTKGVNDQPVQAFYFPDALIKEWLTAMGFDVRARRSSAFLTLRRLFMQNQPTRHEMQVLEAILQQNIRKLKESSLGLAAEQLRDDVGDITI